MTVTLDHHTPLWVASQAIRQCWQSQEKSDTTLEEYRCTSIDSTDNTDYKYLTEYVCGPNDRALIDRIGNKFKHASTLEHLSYNFTIEGVSRALLQELARHRIASLSVKSTRYTLKELKEEEPFVMWNMTRKYTDSLLDLTNAIFVGRASKYIVLTGEDEVDHASIFALENLRIQLKSGVSNDKAKYCLPESYKTSLAWTINARSLQNFLSLRSSSAALWEIRDLAQAIFDALPENHKYLFTDCLTDSEH